MKSINKKKSLFISIFLLLIVVIGLGYAYLTSNLSITGATEVGANTWDIHFENLKVSTGSVTAISPATIDTNKLAITYSIKLDKPGDFYEFTVDIKNDGTLPGKISISNLSGITQSEENIIDYYVKYMNDLDVTTGDIINAGAKKSIKVKVFYKDDISATDLPSTNLNLTLTYSLQYIQSENSNITGTLIKNTGGTYTAFGDDLRISLESFDRVEFKDYKEVPNDAIRSWDASKESNRSIMAWIKDENHNGRYELYVGGDGGVKAPEDFTWGLSYFYNVDYFDVSNLDVSNTKIMKNLFNYTGSMVVNKFEIVGFDKWDTSKVEDMSYMFENTAKNNTISYYKVDVGNFDTSNVKNMTYMFRWAGKRSRVFEIGDLSNWDTRKTTNMSMLFGESGSNCAVPYNFGTLNVYASNISTLFYENVCLSGTVNIHNNASNYTQAFEGATTHPGSLITVNYSSLVTSIDDIIATKSSNSNIIKGSLLSS